MSVSQHLFHIDHDFIRYNAMDVDELFELYARQNFIYVKKRQSLEPVLDQVKKNWAKALKMSFPAFWVSTVVPNTANIHASGSSWQYLNKGILAQHLTADHPIGSRMILLGMLSKVIESQHKGFLESTQIYYRPDNKYPSKVFEAVSARAGSSLSKVIPYCYSEMPFLTHNPGGKYRIEEVKAKDYPGFAGFIKSERGELFFKAQELDSDDINLEQLDKTFSTHGLTRKRKIMVALLPESNKIAGAAIINQSSLGLNFSFFENTCELIFDKNLGEDQLLHAAGMLLKETSHTHDRLPLNYLPVMTDPAHSWLIEKWNGKIVKHYNLFIMLKGGYETWYNQVDEMTRAVVQRFNNNNNDLRYVA